MVTCVPNLDNYSNPHGKRLQKEIDGNDSRWEELTQPKDSSAEESEANNLEHRLEPLRVQGESHESSDEGVFEEIGDSAVENGDLDYDSGAPVNIVARLNNLQAHESGGDEKGRVFLPESERVQGEDLEMKKHHKITEFNDQKWPVIADPVKHRKKTKKKMSSSVKDGPRLVAKAVRAGPEIANETIVLRESVNKAKPVAGAVRGEGKSDQGTRNQTQDRFEIENFESRGRKKRKDAGAAGVKDHGDDNPSIGQLIPQMMIDHNGRPVPVKGRFTTLAG